ncbi:hypothetical protein K1719_002983 [Acacia pycnantha]|nr:hypothetical protein K1719_002983 [Acacia pycnantha]
MSAVKNKEKKFNKFKKRAYVSAIWGNGSSMKMRRKRNKVPIYALWLKRNRDNEEICLRASNPNKWYIDSGCSRHMTGDQSKFASIKHKEGGKVTFGGNESEEFLALAKLEIAMDLKSKMFILWMGYVTTSSV